MKKSIASVLFLCWIASPLFSQIVVNQSDMPSPGDTLRVSITNNAPAGYKKTAMDTTWNFSGLEPLSQRVDTFVNVTSTPGAYQLFFVIMAGANLASPRAGSPIPGLQVTDGFTFFKNSAGSYSELGTGYTIQGLPLPAKYDNPDVYYTFPLQPGATWNSTAAFALDVPDLLYFSTQRIRNSMVDGWGSLTTPFGTYQVLRVRSNITEHDSIYIDSLSAGFPFNRNITEYKWLAKDQGIPLLQVNEEGALATATYRDIPRMSAVPLSVSLGPDTAGYLGTSVTLHAVVAGGTPPYTILWNTLDSGATLTVTVQDIRTYSVVVVDALQNFTSDQIIVSVKYPPGIGEQNVNQGIALPNPTTGIVRLRVPGNGDEAVLRIFSSRGIQLAEKKCVTDRGEVTADLVGLSDGLYLVTVTTPATTCRYKINLLR